MNRALQQKARTFSFIYFAAELSVEGCAYMKVACQRMSPEITLAVFLECTINAFMYKLYLETAIYSILFSMVNCK